MFMMGTGPVNVLNIEEAMAEMVKAVVKYGLDIAAAILILIIGMSIAGWTERFLRRRLSEAYRVDKTLVSFLSRFVKYAILTVTVVAVLSRFGVQTTSLIALLGAAGLAIGLALQGTLSNVAAGVMLLVFRPFRLHDYVEVEGASGTVRDISLFITELDTPDNLRITIPNALIWSSAIKNYNLNATRRIQIDIGIGRDSDLGRVFEVITDLIDAEERVLKTPAKDIFLNNFGASSLDLVIRMWVKSPDYWPVRGVMMRNIKEAFDREGIEIPFPHQVEILKDPSSAPDRKA